MVSAGISNYVKATFNVNCNHPSSIFTSNDRDVTGNINLNFIKKLDSVYSIEYGLMGHCQISFNDAQTRFDGKTTKIIRNKIQKTYELFDVVNQAPSFMKKKLGYYGFKENEHVKIPINISFPINGAFLPSSTKGFGSDIHNQGILCVYYTLYLKITRKTSILGKPAVDYVDFPLIYQAHASYFEGGPTNKLVEFSDTKIFQIKNSKPLGLNNTESPKTVDLTVFIKIPRHFDFRVSAFSQIWFELETSYNCNINQSNSMGDLKDSGLGGFEIKEIKFIAHSKSISTVEGRTYEDEQNILLAKISGLDLNFSISDFKYYPTRQKFAVSMGGKPLVDKTSSKSMMEFMFPQTFMPMCKLYDWYENVCHLNIILTISDDSNCNQEFEYFTSVSPDYLNMGILQFTRMNLESLFNEEQAEPLESGNVPSYNELPVEYNTRQLRTFNDEKIPVEDPPPYEG